MADADLHGDRTVELELIADPTLGYASWQNHVPLVRALSLTNAGADTLSDVQVALTIDPPVAEPFVIRFAQLAPGETRRVSPVDMKCHHQALAKRTERERATLHARAMHGDTLMGETSHDLEVLARDQWAGSRALPELLAAFCTPNDPIVDQLIGKAAHALGHRGALLNGYQSGSREAVLAQVAAVYATIAAEELAYANPPASFGSQGQKVRTPDRIASGRIATCLDSALLFASCLEQAGLNPVLLLAKNHAFAGCWLTKQAFPEPTNEDVQAVRKRVDSGELVVFETTLATQQPPGTFRAAVARGRDHLTLDEAEFEFAIDVAAARRRHIVPLPTHGEAAPPPESAAGTPRIDELPELPPLDLEAAADIVTVEDETPAGRLARWQNKLLDLTLHNRLINFKPANSNMELLVPDPAHLEDRLVAGSEFRVQGKPELMEGADPRDANVRIARSGERPLPQLARELMEQKTLLALVEPGKLDARLLEVYTNARLSLEEGGSNTLFLALGFLKWRDVEKGTRDYLAPLLLIPVTIKRQSVRSGYTLMRHDDETLVNPTLLQLLRTEYELTVAGLDPLPRDGPDGEGVDVARVWQSFRTAIANVQGWEVLDKVFLGTFSFTKHLMWKDLHSRLAELRRNRVVAHLIDSATAAGAPAEARAVSERTLDEEYAPQTLFAPRLADSSQLRAIALADAGRDFVLDGPPGTGKSQTITNVITHFLGKGKTVLFVSEKIAALNVVHTRLEELGLGPFCLELHSAKAKKTEVMRQLETSLTFAGARSAEDWEHEASRLAALRQDLNAFVRVLHQVHPNGLNVHVATGLVVLKSHWRPAHFEWTDADTHDRAALTALRELVGRISALGASFSTLKAHGLEGITHAQWSPMWEDELFLEAEKLERLAAEMESAADDAVAACGLALPSPSWARLTALDTLADVLVRATAVPPGLAARACDPATQGQLHQLRTHGERRRSLWTSFGGYADTVASLSGAELMRQWLDARATWWPKRWFGQRAIANVLKNHRLDRQRPVESQIEDLLKELTLLNQEDAALAQISPAIAPLLAQSYQGLKTDWAGLARHAAWCKSFEEASARFAGGDIATVQDVRVRLGALVGEHQRLLDPSQGTGAALLKMREAYRNFAAKAQSVEALAGGAALCGNPEEPAALTRARSTVQRWRSARRQIHAWCLWQYIRSQSLAQGLASLVAALENGAIKVAEVVDFFEYSYQNWWLKRVIDREPVLREFASADHERKIGAFRAADERFEKLTCQYVIARLAERIPNGNVPAGPESEIGRLRRDIRRQRGLTPIRQVMGGLPNLLPKLKPCLLMSPLSVAQYLDASHPPFDLVVFDEASQIPVWDAVGAIARGRQLLVAGDPLQLPPTSFFQRAYDGDAEGDDSGTVEDLESVLDECLATGLPRQQLKWHYRSRHESLIAFSNFTYYGGNLVTFPSPVTHDTSVIFRHVRGVYDRGASKTNRAEAEAIVAEIEKHYLDEVRRGKSVGVVTFNQPQMTLIQTLLDARRAANSTLDGVLAEIANEELFIKNLENVQGDERDFIFFSVTYGPDLADKVTMNMGPLGKEGGHRRLNVAISRAREQVMIFSTMLPEQIDPARARGQGIGDLKAYLDFARRGKVALLARSSPTGLEPDSPFEVAVLRALRERGWLVHPQVGCSDYRVDIGVVNPNAPGEYLMGVECDGRTYHSAATARDRDRLRQLVLERLGWRLHRIWSTDWWHDTESEIEKLDAALKARLAAAASEPKHAPVTAKPALPPDEDRAQYARGPQAPRPYVTFARHEFPSRHGRRFDDRVYDSEIADEMIALVNAEGPILEDDVFKRITLAWGIERVGNRIAERLTALRPRALALTREGGRFYWPAGVDPTIWRGFRAADDSLPESRRHIEAVALEEIANAAEYLLANGGETPKVELAKSVCRFFGMGRITAESQARAAAGIERLATEGRVRTNGEAIAPCICDGRP
ncbi:MAG: DUF3320 domain-containing protein [Burkholderiales bacterium]